MRLPAGHYAVLEHAGHISSLRATWGVAMQWLATNGTWHDADTPPFERYDARYDAATGLGGCEVWMPVVRATCGHHPWPFRRPSWPRFSNRPTHAPNSSKYR